MEKEGMRLNRFIAQAGVCSRRKADLLIASGQIKVNGQVAYDLSYRVVPQDQVIYGGKRLSASHLVYFMLHKPSNMITSLADQQGRRTLQDVIQRLKCGRLYPIGRLDRNSTGLLLLTNDGALSRILAHPSSEVPKQYELLLDPPLSEEAKQQLRKGVQLEDGWMFVDALTLAKGGKQVNVTIHSGRNRILRRLFAHLGYRVRSLCRVSYGPLLLSSLSYGSVRPLTPTEVEKLRKYRKKTLEQEKGGG